MTKTTKLSLATILVAFISAPFAFAQGTDSAGEGQNVMMGGDVSGMRDGDMSGMMGMMQMMQQMGPMMEACTEMMQAMATRMEPTPEVPSTPDDQG